MPTTLVACFALAACGESSGNNNNSNSDGGVDLATPAPDMAGGQCSAKTVPCTDDQIQDQSLFKKASTRKIENTADGAGWNSRVDASGGVPPGQPVTPVEFTPTGLQRVAVGDEDAFTSMDWDIAFRRFIIRLNSGVSGPSCVTARAHRTGTIFDDLTSVPQASTDRTESYFDEPPELRLRARRLGPDEPGHGAAELLGVPRLREDDRQRLRAHARRRQARQAEVQSYYSPPGAEQCDTRAPCRSRAASGHVTYEVGLPAVRRSVATAVLLVARRGAWRGPTRRARPTSTATPPADVVESFPSAGGHFRIYFTRAGANAVAVTDANMQRHARQRGGGGRLYEQVLTFYQGLGFRAPPSRRHPDAATTAATGASTSTCSTSPARPTAPSRGSVRWRGLHRLHGPGERLRRLRIPVDAVGNRILASHEFFHAVQAAYDVSQSSIFSEGTAVWATEQFDPTLDDFEG